MRSLLNKLALRVVGPAAAEPPPLRLAIDGDAAGLRERLAAKERELDELRRSKDRELQAVWDHAHKLDAALQALDRLTRSADYSGDSLVVYHRNLSFLRDPRFTSAYRRGVHSGHKLGRHARDGGEDIHIEWRVLVACWAAERARRLDGCLVECGVNTGILSLAVCEYIDFNATGKEFYLFDTFRGIPEEQMRPEERALRVEENASIYEECFDVARRNFAPFPRPAGARAGARHPADGAHRPRLLPVRRHEHRRAGGGRAGVLLGQAGAGRGGHPGRLRVGELPAPAGGPRPVRGGPGGARAAPADRPGADHQAVTAARAGRVRAAASGL